MGKLYACIMAGGSGTRFWPESTVKHPKQLLAIGCERPLLLNTVQRISPLISPERQIVITGKDIATKISEIAPAIPEANIVIEPLRRNTAPCVLLAAKVIASRDPEGVMAVLPSDHLIAKSENFLKILRSAAELATKTDALITFGIKPGFAETGFGYVEFGQIAGSSGDFEYSEVRAFHEKPDLETAAEYLKRGNFYWNSGMFVWSVKAILSEFKTHMPELVAAFEGIRGDEDPSELTEQLRIIYKNLKGISVDYGILEHAERIYGFPADIGWNDVGSWSSLGELIEADENGNVFVGKVESLDSADCIASAKEGVAVLVGVSDLIVVHTSRATLVCEKSQAQKIKKVYDLLEEKGLKEYL
jgi:mannose-1-phosphate guanylyltransferase